MTKIKLNDRVKHVDGRVGTVFYDDKQGDLPMRIAWEGGRIDCYDRDEAFVEEVIGHRYFVDTPFEIGETYETEVKGIRKTVTGVGLICENQYGYATACSPSGLAIRDDDGSLILPTPKPETKPCEGREVDIDGVKYRLVPVENEE